MAASGNGELRFGAVAAKLVANGYSVVPLHWKRKTPSAGKKWQYYKFTAADAERYKDAGVGILCGQVIALDFDVRNEALVAQIEALAESTFGPAPRRVGAAPKALRVYRTEKPFAKLMTRGYRLPGDNPEDKAHRVEVLGRGLQFVAYNVHPDTGQPYAWGAAGEPLSVPVQELPAISQEQALTFVSACDRIMSQRGRVLGALAEADDTREHKPSERMAADDPKTLREAIQAIKNEDLDYDSWVRVGLAIRGALGDDGRDDFVQWSQRSSKYQEAETLRVWASLKPQRIGAGSILHWAHLAGWSPSGNDNALAEMNAQHAVINWKGRTLILKETVDPSTRRPGIELSSVRDKRTWFANTKPVMKKEQYVPRFDWWLSHPERRQYLGVVFEPQREVESYYNLWHGWGVQAAPGDCSLWLDMVRDVICSKNEELYHYVLTWCADAVQNPTVRPGVVLVLRGLQGTGKSTFAKTLGKLFGDHFLQISSMHHLTGHFNAHLANVLLLFADEAYFPGDRSGEGALKALITEPYLMLEPKGRDAIAIPNNLRTIMASNSEWIVPTSWDDRRFPILDVSRERAQDSAYFGAIKTQLEAGGYEALLYYLQNYPADRVDLRKIPDTRARRDQQLHSLDPFQAFWLHWLENPPVTDQFIATNSTYDDYRKTTGRWAIEKNVFFGRFTKTFPKAQHVRATQGKMRVYGYKLPALAEMRQNFDDTFGKKTEWPPDADTVDASELTAPYGEEF